MKKLMYFAAALLVLVGCNKKDNALNNAPEGTPFEKGQKVTLTVGTGAQQGPNRVAGVDNTAENRIDFTWVEGDQILVKVGQESAVFTLSSEPGLVYGEFAGEMPAAGSTFDIQYPIVDSYLNEQNYTTENPICGYKMLFKATGCTLDGPASLAAQYAMVQLNLYGTDKTIGQIVLTNTTAEPAESYTLTCTDGVTIGATSTTATPFYMIVPAGAYKFEVEVYDNAATPAEICSFATSAAQTLTAGKCLNMPAKEVKDPYNGHDYVDLGLSVKWATCNVGATTPEGYGDYFAWGETETKTSYTRDNYNYTDNPTTLPLDHDAAAANWKGAWRMPTKAEFEELKNTQNCEWKWCDGQTEKYNNTTVKGYLVKSLKAGYTDNSIFLPASGYRTSRLNDVGEKGYYWSSSLYESTRSDNACYLYFYSDDETVRNNQRWYGQSVRPVCPKN